jgi:hypothetical protein
MVFNSGETTIGDSIFIIQVGLLAYISENLKANGGHCLLELLQEMVYHHILSTHLLIYAVFHHIGYLVFPIDKIKIKKASVFDFLSQQDIVFKI